MKHIATEPATAPILPVTPPEAWTGYLLITPDQVQQILDANELADATEEQA